MTNNQTESAVAFTWPFKDASRRTDLRLYEAVEQYGLELKSFRSDFEYNTDVVIEPVLVTTVQ